MRSFVHETPPPRVVFGAGTVAEVGAELDRLDVTRAVVLSTPGQVQLAGRVADLLGSRVVGRFSAAVPHTPVEVTEQALAVLNHLGGDVVISVGSGSTTGLGKAVGSRLGIRHLVLPTTYAGSELTSVLGETSRGEKNHALPARDPAQRGRVRRRAHAHPAVVGDADQRSQRAGARGRGVVWRRREPGERRARVGSHPIAGFGAARSARGPPQPRGPAELLYGAWLAGRCLAEVGMGLHHKLCHTLGEAFDLPHAPTHAVVLPYAMAYNEPAVAVVMDRIAEALASHSAPRAVQSLVRELRGPTTLAKIGLAGGDLERAADLAVARPYPNPRPVTRAGVLQLLQRAFSGELLRGR